MYLSSGRYPLRIRGDTLGEPVTFGLPKREKKLTLAYRCGEREGVIAENTTREEILWTPPLELAEAFPEKSRIPLTVVLTAPDGSRREERWELRLPADILPELQLEAEDVTGLGVFVQGPGRLRLRAQAQGRYGAGIRKILLRCGGSPGEGESRIFDLPEPGEVTVSARVWDSRGRSVRRETTLSVLPWEPPKGGLGQIQEKNGLYLAQWWGKVSDVAGKNQGTFTLVVPKGEKELRFPLGEGRELAGQTGVTKVSAGDRLILEAADRLTTVHIPCLLEPFLWGFRFPWGEIPWRTWPRPRRTPMPCPWARGTGGICGPGSCGRTRPQGRIFRREGSRRRGSSFSSRRPRRQTPGIPSGSWAFPGAA